MTDETMNASRLCREFRDAWRDREKALAAQREADDAVRRANDRVTLTTTALGPLCKTEGGGWRDRYFDLGDDLVTVSRDRDVVTATVSPIKKGEKV